MSDPKPEWVRLGRLLTQRRGQLGSEYLNRQRFVQTTGLNERLVSDLENARREGYRPATVAAVEAAYKWSPGSIDRVLAGGEPELLDDQAASNRFEVIDGGGEAHVQAEQRQIISREEFWQMLDRGEIPPTFWGRPSKHEQGFWTESVEKHEAGNSFYPLKEIARALERLRDLDTEVKERRQRRDPRQSDPRREA